MTWTTRLPHLAIFFVLATCTHNTLAQQSSYLRLGAFNSNRPVHFHVNDEIRFKPRGETEFIKARILGFKEDTLIFRFFEYPISQMATIDIRQKERRFSRTSLYGKQLIWVGPAYFAMASLNFGELQPRTLLTGAIISGIGWLLTQLPKKYYHVSSKHPAKVVLDNF